MIQKELAKARVDQAIEAKEEISLKAIVLILVINLIGFWFILPSVLLFFGFFLDDFLSFPSLAGPGGAHIFIGAFVAAPGLLLSFYSILFFAYFGDGMPIASLPPKRFVKAGPYSRSRHPIYLGYTISLIGLGLIFGSGSFLIFIIPLFTLCWVSYAVLHEEKVLARRYGTQYCAYRDSTPLLFSRRSLNISDNAPAPPLMYMVSAVIFKSLGKFFFNVEVSGNPAPELKGPFIMIASHGSYLDPFFINSCIRNFVRVSATEKAFRRRVWRFYLKAVGAFPVARYKMLDVSVLRESIRVLSNGASIGIFPEGGRTWDGRPQEISDTIIRFLQHAGRPIIAVSLSGNYNVFPRWARRPHRGKIMLHFHDPFIFPRENTVEENKLLLQEKLFSPYPCYNAALRLSSKKIADGVPLLLWRCPLCRTNDSLKTRRQQMVCASCGSAWELQPNYHLKLLRNGVGSLNCEAQTLGDWYDMIKEPLVLSSFSSSHKFVAEAEKVFLESGRVIFSGYENLRRTYSNRGRLVLTDLRLIFFNRRLCISEQFDTIQKMTIEGNNQLEIAFPGRIIAIAFESESPLKWQEYISRIRSGPCRST